MNAYNALARQNGPPRASWVRLLGADDGSVVRTVSADADGRFVLTQLVGGRYQIQAGEDEDGDGIIGVPGRRFGWARAGADPGTVVVEPGGSSARTTVVMRVPGEAEPNDSPATANVLTAGRYVVGRLEDPDVVDWFEVTIPLAGEHVERACRPRSLSAGGAARSLSGAVRSSNHLSSPSVLLTTESSETPTGDGR